MTDKENSEGIKPDLKKNRVPPKRRSKAGHPQKTLTKKELKQIKELAGYQCTWTEIATLIEWALKTLEKNEDAKKAYAEGAAEGMMSLRRTQFLIATED